VDLSSRSTLRLFVYSRTYHVLDFLWIYSMYAITCAFFAYAEGYKGFQLKFSPLVVKRSSTLVVGTRQGNNPLNYLLAPLYSCLGQTTSTHQSMHPGCWSGCRINLGKSKYFVLLHQVHGHRQGSTSGCLLAVSREM
jgi:hypothetical protein